MLKEEEFNRAFNQAMNKLDAEGLKWITESRLTERAYVLGIIEFSEILGIDFKLHPLFAIMRNLEVRVSDFEKDLFPETPIGQAYTTFRLVIEGFVQLAADNTCREAQKDSYRGRLDDWRNSRESLLAAVEGFRANQQNMVSIVRHELGKIDNCFENIRREPFREPQFREWLSEIVGRTRELDQVLRDLTRRL